MLENTLSSTEPRFTTQIKKGTSSAGGWLAGQMAGCFSLSLTLGQTSTRVARFLSPPLSDSCCVKITSDPSLNSGKFLR